MGLRLFESKEKTSTPELIVKLENFVKQWAEIRKDVKKYISDNNNKIEITLLKKFENHLLQHINFLKDERKNIVAVPKYSYKLKDIDKMINQLELDLKWTLIEINNFYIINEIKEVEKNGKEN